MTVCGANLINAGVYPLYNANAPSFCINLFAQSIGPLYSPGCMFCIRLLITSAGQLKPTAKTDATIADENFNPENFGKSMDDLMARIHAQLPDGSTEGRGRVLLLGKRPGNTTLQI